MKQQMESVPDQEIRRQTDQQADRPIGGQTSRQEGVWNGQKNG